MRWSTRVYRNRGRSWNNKIHQSGTAFCRTDCSCKTVLEETRIGDSIAVNGICLTVRQLFPDSFAADVMHETLNRSALAQLTVGSAVNLERAMPANGRFGGHIVAGHVDGVGRIANIRKDDTSIWYTIHADPAILRYVVEKALSQ